MTTKTYVCAELAQSGQDCKAWVLNTATLMQDFAITKQQALQLAEPVISILFIIFCYKLFKQVVLRI